ncbi:MAG: hypothetical protein SGPRY_014324, partial [Prymnesium sp.]
MDVQNTCPSTSFAEFRAKMLETLAVADARFPAESNLLSAPDSKDKKHNKSQCKFCDLKSCSAATIRKCYVCSDSDDVPVPGVSTYQKMLAKIYRTYRRENKLTNMKSKRIPEEWFQRAKKRFGKKAGDESSMPQSGMLVIEEIDSEEDFWSHIQRMQSTFIVAEDQIKAKRKLLESTWQIYPSPGISMADAEASLRRSVRSQHIQRESVENQTVAQKVQRAADLQIALDRQKSAASVLDKELHEIKLRDAISQQFLRQSQSSVTRLQEEVTTLREQLFDARLLSCTKFRELEDLRDEVETSRDACAREQVASRSLAASNERLKLVASVVKTTSTNKTWIRVVTAGVIACLARIKCPLVFQRVLTAFRRVLLHLVRQLSRQASRLLVAGVVRMLSQLCASNALDHTALMGAAGSIQKQAVMYDTGCTTLMTNSTKGLV